MRSEGLWTGFELDRRWHWLRGEMDETKKPALERVALVFADAGVAYALIGGVALQVLRSEPRTTLDIDIAVIDRSQVPRAALEAAGFRATGSFEHSENWSGPGGTPLQITDDPALRDAILRAEPVPLGSITLQVLRAEDMLHAKLRAASDPARRRSKRLQDLADAEGLLEDHPELEAALTEAERAVLGRG
jgi:hypothetical protein